MLRRLQPRLTYGNVAATLALFIALGGTAIAIQNNSVRSRHIAPGAVKRSDTNAQLRLKCQKKLRFFAGVCIERNSRPGDVFDEASLDCRNDRKRLPTAGELALFRREPGITLAGDPGGEWTGDFYIDGSDTRIVRVAEQGGQSVALSNGTNPYRCVRAPKR